MRVIGLMSGTSCDGIEGAAADLELAANELILQPLGERRHPYDSGLREAIAAALPPMPTTAQAICELHTRIGQAFADIAQEMVELVCGGRADLVVSHGQTVFHWVEEEPGRSAAGGRVLVEALPGQEPGRSVAGGRVLGTLQLGQPAWIAERTGVPVVSDLRSRDVAAGGLDRKSVV